MTERIPARPKLMSMFSTTRTRERAGAVVEHGRAWIEQQDPSSRPGFAIGAWRRYRLVAYFVWAPRLLTHKLLGWRQLLPGALLTALGLVLLMVVSSFVMEFWVDFYARDYGGFGVVMAISFWIGFSSAVIVGAASLAPVLVERRSLRSAPAR